jgi:asparagine synthase (glutamine-hydrolysing)
VIGLYHRWQGDPVPQSLAERFAASLGLGDGGLIAQASLEDTVLASRVADVRHRRGWQPTRMARGDALLFTGHIDNRAALCRLLTCSERLSDAALYGAGYDAWGDAVDLKLIGQFATILWSPDVRTVRLARSPLRAPPLHIWHDAQRVMIASAARAIFSTGEVAQVIDEQKIADSLFLNYNEGTRGWFRGVTRLPAGTRAHITAEGVRITPYYDLKTLPPVRLPRDDDYVEAANALMEAGTRAALSGFARPAVSLSGGYDSQAVAAYALKMRPDARVLGLTSVPEAGWDGRCSPHRFGDERAHVAALAAMHPRLDVEWIESAGLSFDHKLQAMFLLAGAAPRNGVNLHWIHEVQGRAKARGCDVLLTGAMGNATISFDGSGAMPDWFRRGQWATLWRELRAAQADGVSLVRLFAARVLMSLLPATFAKAIDERRHGKAPSPFNTWCPLNPEWAREMRVAERAAEQGFDPLFTAFRSTHDWRAAVMGGTTNEGGDIQSAFDTIHGIPTRDPTVYRPLVEFCMGIPDDQYLRNGEARWLAKRMLKGVVPDMVLNETRRGKQAADWHLRMGRDLGALKAEIGRLSRDPVMAKRLNLSGLATALDNWPAQMPLDRATSTQLQLAVSRAITTARFIHYVEGRNDG